MIGNLIGRIAMADKMSVSQLEEALQNKTLPAYIAIPLIEEKTSMAQRMQMAQAAQSQAPQMPIADEVLQKANAVQMGGGIDALPTNLPMQEAEGMAGGGIVAFERGGPISFQNTGLVRDPVGFDLPMSSGAVDPKVMRAFYLSRGMPLPPELMTPEEKARAPRTQQLNEPYPAGVIPKVGRFFSNIGTAAENAITGGMGFDYYSQPETTSAAPATTAATPKADARIPDTAVAPPAGKPPAAGADQGIAGLPSNLALPKPPEVGGTRAALDKTLTDYLGRSEEREKRLMESLGRDRLQGKAFQDYEQTLRREAEAAGAEKEDAKGMALLKAGLAMMAGTSQHALENIGKGAMVGVADYQAAYKDLKKAERERTKEFALIEQARRAEEKGDLERRDNLLMRASDAAQKRDDFGTRAIMEAGIKDADRAFDVWKTQYAGGITLAAAQARRGQANLTQAQLGKFRQDAVKAFNAEYGGMEAFRNRIAKQLNLKTAPPPGVNAKFDNDVNKAREQFLMNYLEDVLGTGTAGSGLPTGFRLVTDEE